MTAPHVVNHVYAQPSPPLDAFIEFLWAADAYPAQSPRERILPSGAPALVVHLEAAPLRVFADERASEPAVTSGAFLCGARQTPLVIGTALGATVGVHFKPGGARPFFDIPAGAIAEQTVPLEALWGASALSLRERLLDAHAPVERVRILEACLRARAHRALELSPMLSLSFAAFAEPDLVSVAEVNRRTGLSPKRLLALFRDEVGLSPKAFWRVRRFRAALHDLDRGALRGAALAHEHGYFDQAHFLREFRTLAGSSPSAYLAARVLGTDHVSVGAEKRSNP
ncbi:MAG: helix-turn-helix domain-containing protein [Polyangiales bacterium]